MSTAKVDYMAVLVGPPGHGKSSLAAELAEKRLREGRWVLVQDMNREFGRFCAPYANEAEFLELANRASKEDRPCPAGAAFPLSADRVLALAVQLGTSWNLERGHVSEPICVVINETTSFEGSGSTFVGQDLARAVAQRRHLGLEMIYCMQHAAQLPESIFEFVTEVHMFRQTRSDRTDKLERTVGLERGSLEGLLKLEPHRYATWRPMVGLC